MSDGWDALIVGAGPAGSTAARLLAGRGHRVLLVDRSDFPRSKPCGESINPGAVAELDELGLLESVLELPHRRIAGWRIHPERAAGFEGRFLRGAFGLGMDRATFDQALLEHAQSAGATVRTGLRVTDLLREGDRVAGARFATGEEIRSRILIGADGLRSIVVRRLDLIRRRPELRKVALTAHVSARAPGGSLGELYVRPWGCIGVAAVDQDCLNVVVVLDSAATTLSGSAEDSFDRLIRSVAPLRAARRTSEVLTTGPFDWPTRGTTAGGALLIGDAAGYYDPFTGQGIFRALRGARLAADVVERCLTEADCSAAALAPFEGMHRAAFGNGRRLQRVIQVATSRPRIFGVAASVLRKLPPLADRLVSVTGDMRPLRTLLVSGSGTR